MDLTIGCAQPVASLRLRKKTQRERLHTYRGGPPCRKVVAHEVALRDVRSERHSAHRLVVLDVICPSRESQGRAPTARHRGSKSREAGEGRGFGRRCGSQARKCLGLAIAWR